MKNFGPDKKLFFISSSGILLACSKKSGRKKLAFLNQTGMLAHPVCTQM
jgi:hypothetical protein